MARKYRVITKPRWIINQADILQCEESLEAANNFLRHKGLMSAKEVIFSFEDRPLGGGVSQVISVKVRTS